MSRLLLMPLVALLALMLSACGLTEPQTSETKVRDLTKEEALADFNYMVDAVRTYYGPLEYKERRFGFTLNDIAEKTRNELQASRNDGEHYAAFKRFLAQLDDGHVGIRFPLSSDGATAFQIGIFLAAVEGQAVVDTVADSLADTGITRGDVIVSVDGRATMDFLSDIKRYDALGQDDTEEQFIFRVFSRPAYMTELLPQNDMALIVVRKADGEEFSVELPWIPVQPERRQDFVQDLRPDFSVAKATELNAAASVNRWGAENPFFFTPEVKDQFSMRELVVSEESKAKYGAEATDWKVFTALYRYQGKNILLVRQPRYAAAGENASAKYIAYYKAVLDEFEELADVLVVDQTHNTGGIFCQEFFRLFIDQKHHAFVQFNNADRDWVVSTRTMWPEFLGSVISDTGPAWEQAMARIAAATERDYDSGLSMTREALPLIGGFNQTGPYADYHWSKPFIVLIDEMAGSCGDIYPMLIKASGVAPLFGMRTAGLGGNVSQMATLPNSLAAVRLTRGLYTTYKPDGNYTDADMMENNGVLPDIEYDHTLEDYRAGYVGYVERFSEEALKLLAE